MKSIRLSGPTFWAILFLLAFILRLTITHAFVGIGSEPDGNANNDQLEYVELATQVAEGNGYRLEGGELTARRPPGTSVALLAIFVPFGANHSLARIWFCFISAITCVLAGLFAASAFGETTGRWAAVALALYPGHIYYAMHFLSEPVFALLIIGFCASSYRAFQQSTGRVSFSAVAGICLGAAILTRPMAILVLPIAILMIALTPAFRRKTIWRTAFLQAAVVLSVIMPWIVRNHIAIDKATISTVGGLAFWQANNHAIDAGPNRGYWMRTSGLADEDHPIPGGEVQREEAYWSYGLEFLRENPGRIPGLLVMKLTRLISPFKVKRLDLDSEMQPIAYWSFALAWIISGPLAALGYYLAAKRNPLATVILSLPLLALLITTLVFYGSVRFRDSLCVVFLIFSAVAIADIQRRVLNRLRAR